MYRLIFVDDEDVIRESFKEILSLSDFGFQLIDTFSSAESALSYLNKHPVDVIITDIKMGQMSGLELCSKAREILPNVVLIVFTGYKDFEYAQQAIRQNVFDYLVKPTSYADLEDLFTRLKKYMDTEYSSAVMHDEPEYHDIVSRMKLLAQKNFSSNFSLDMVADRLSMNAAYLSRLFKQQCGQNYSDYLTELRIQRAQELMKDPTIKIYEIGYRVGYKNTQYFYKVFKQATGMTPKEYRLAHTKIST